MGDACATIPVAGTPSATVPVDETAPTEGDVNVLGALTGEAFGDSFGEGGLGGTGSGEGGGGRGEGIGLGSIGTLGHGSGLGRGGGLGPGIGRLGGPHGKKLPSVRMGATSVSGRLPAELIQRIVRQQFGAFRTCYETELKTDPTLTGVITVRFTINPDGSVSKVDSTGMDVMAPCVTKRFEALSFPQPEPTFTVDGKSLTELTPEALTAKIGAKGWRAAAVPGPTPDAPFAVFAMKSDQSMSPTWSGFLTSVRRVRAASTPDAAIVQATSGVALVYEGPRAEELSASLTESHGEVTVVYPIAFSPGG